MRSLLTPKKRCSRPATGLAIACPSSAEAPSCCHDCGDVVLLSPAALGLVDGARPVASSATISLNWSGGSERGVKFSLLSGPETVSVTSMPRAFVSRSMSRIGSIFSGL